MNSFFAREATVARPGYSRWMVPPAALAVHICIGQVYGFSVFNVPLTRILGITQSNPGDWNIPTVGWIYTIALFVLGSSAALFGKWVERVGPRLTMFTAACCFGGGFLVSCLGVMIHNIWLIYLGYGVLGGIGLGLGYISPVSTLVKWFPDRPGMATGLAIMGFGGGAMIGAPLAQELLTRFRTPNSVGVAQTFAVMGLIYFIFMMFGVFIVRVPPRDYKGAGATSEKTRKRRLVTNANVSVDVAWRTPQFWLLWAVLCLNVSAGIGILGQASLLCQDMFGVSAAVGAGFAGLLSVANMLGRFGWSSLSDVVGRKNIYILYFVFGAALYCLIPLTQSLRNLPLFLLVCLLIISMYGGGFATIPAYLRDVFGSMEVGAIHGRLITAWSIAAVIGPVLINYISTYQKQAGVPKQQAYNSTMYIMAGLLLLGLLCNLLVSPVHSKFHHQPASAPVRSASEI
jgi:MFS family permease